MKLSYSIRYWTDIDWQEACTAAAETKMAGVELCGIGDDRFSGKSSPTNPELASSTRRKLGSNDLCVPCVDTVSDFTSDEFLVEFSEAVDVAVNLGSPYVSIHTADTDKERSTDRWEVEAQHDHFWLTKIYTYETLRYDRDMIQALEARYRVGLGVG